MKALKYAALWIAFLGVLYVANFTTLGAWSEWLGPQGITKLLW